MSKVGAPTLWNPSTRVYEFQKACTYINGVKPSQLSGTHTIWTPAAGKRIRFMGGQLNLTKDFANAAGAQEIYVTLGPLLIFDLAISDAAAYTNTDAKIIDMPSPPGGILGAVNAVLSIGNSVSVSAGSYHVLFWGGEE